MSKRLYITDCGKIWLEQKLADPDGYAAEQEEMRQCFETGKRFWLKRVFQKQCPICGDVFYTTTNTKKYDTDYCKDRAKQARAKKPNFNTCIVCGKVFEPVRHDALYCSGACRQKAHRNRKQPRNQ